MLYIKDHNGNKFYPKLYCVILDELSVFTTLFFCQIKRKKERKRSIRDRSLNRQTSGYTYVRIPYIERLVLPTLFTKYTLLSPCDVTNPF